MFMFVVEGKIQKKIDKYCLDSDIAFRDTIKKHKEGYNLYSYIEGVWFVREKKNASHNSRFSRYF